MIRLTDEQWERSRIIFRRNTLPVVVLDASRSRHVAFLKQSCGFSTQVRNGIYCRKAIPTTKRYIGVLRLGAAMRRLLTDVANELRDRGALDEEECFIDATQGWRGRDWGDETRKRHENHGDC